MTSNNNNFDYKLDREKDNKPAAGSAGKAVADIEEKVKEINKSSPNNFPKDPNSRFITSNDVKITSKLLDLGVYTVLKKKTNKIMSSSQTSPHKDKNLDLRGKSEQEIKSIIAYRRQSCPVCSVINHSYFPMQWVEDAGIWHCYSCSMTINPFEEPVPLAHVETDYGLSAIHDDYNPEHQNKNKPVVVSASRKNPGDKIQNLQDRRKSDELDTKLKRIKA